MQQFKWNVLFAATALLCPFGRLMAEGANPEVAKRQSRELFEKRVWPAIETRCLKCHGSEKQKGEYRIDSKDAAFKGGESKTAPIVPGDAMKSPMVRRITLPKAHDDAMPPEGKGELSPEEILAFIHWIDFGAEWMDVKPSAQSAADPKATGEGAKVEVKEEPLAQVPPADPKAIGALHQAGALAGPLAQNTNLLNVDFLRVASKIDDSHLALLKPLAAQVYWLSLANTKVTDAGLANVVGMTNLKRLSLEKTAITDAGLIHLKDLASLESLNLYGTQVSDAGLSHLQGFRCLKKLYLWQTKVSEEGAKKLAEAMPGLKVETGWKAPPVVAAPSPINEKCPFTQKPIDLVFTFTHKEEKVGFCCGNCLVKFQEKPDEHFGKVKATN